MARNTCPACGAVTDDPAQKFCTQCGTRLPNLPDPVGTGRGFPVWIVAGACIIVILVFVAVLWPPVSQALSLISHSGLTGSGPGSQFGTSGEITRIPATQSPGTTPVQTPSTMVATITKTTPGTTVTTATPRATPVPTTKVTPVTTVATAAPTLEITSQITLSVTQVPPQPPSDSLTSNTPGAPYIDPYALETRFHELINIQRQQNGLSTLSYDSFLADIARGHSWDMAVNNYFEHTDPAGLNARGRGDWAGYPCVRDYKSYYTSGISENLYQGYRYQTYLTAPNGTIVLYNWSTVEFIANQAVNGWMNSEGHRNNILDYHFQQEGIGVAFSSDDKIYVTENFC